MWVHTRSQAATLALVFFTLLSFEAFATAVVHKVETPRRICLNVRTQARSGAAVSECVPNGRALRILEHNPTGYSRVDLGGRTGYVWTKYLRADRATTPSPTPRTPANLSQLMLTTAKSLETDEIGRGRGFTLTKSVGWAKLERDGEINVQGSKRSHCTSATHAALLKTLGELHKQGRIDISEHARKALNSGLFRDVWNSNGYGPAKVIELLGGQNFRDINEAKPGDIVKIDRANGTGHMVLFSRKDGDKICYWSSNRRTKGLGENCEAIGRSKFVFSRFTDMGKLQAGLNNLDSNLRVDSAFADVRARQGHGFVKLAALDLARRADVRAPVELRTRYVQLGESAERATDAVQ